jgi:hypothetical protein
MAYRTVTVVEEMRKNGDGYYKTESRVPFVRLRGRWLEKLGFTPGAKAYISEMPNGLLISSQPPAGTSVSDMKPLSEIKAQFKALGIETEQRSKKRAKPDPTPAERGEPFIVPTCGIANTDPLDMDDETYAQWIACLQPEGKKHWLSLRALKPPEPTPKKVAWTSKNASQPDLWASMLPQTAAAQANVIHELPDDIPPDQIQFFKPREIGAKAYKKICNDN